MEINFYSTKGEYGFLSNFYQSTFFIHEADYPTIEHYYQSKKSIDFPLEFWISCAPTAYAAMKAGRECLRTKQFDPDWDTKKVNVMLTGLRAKFTQNKELADKLLATGDAILHEDSPTDMFWGKKGQDMLGKLLMQIREELKSLSV